MSERTYEDLYFDDATLATKVWICVSAESAMPYDTRIEDYIEDDPRFNDRMRFILDYVKSRAATEFPNAEQWIIDGGFENEFSPFFPSRVQDENGRSYEHEGDTINDFVDEAIAKGWANYPAPDEEEDDE